MNQTTNVSSHQRSHFHLKDYIFRLLSSSNDGASDYARESSTSSSPYLPSSSSSSCTPKMPRTGSYLSIPSYETRDEFFGHSNYAAENESTFPLHNDRNMTRKRELNIFEEESLSHYYSTIKNNINSSSDNVPLLIKVLTTLSVCSVLISVGSLGLSVQSYIEKNRVISQWNTIKDAAYHACVPCSLLTEEDRDIGNQIELLTKKEIDNKIMCCALDSKQMSVFMQLMITHQQNETVDQALMKRRVPVFSPVSAHKHLHLHYESGDTNDARIRDNLTMNIKDEGVFEHARLVTTTNSSLKIQYKGWYYLYSSVYFKNRSDQHCQSHESWRHYIKRLCPHNENLSRVLVQSAHSCCTDCVEDNHTSHAAGVFMLDAGDEVYVEVSGHGFTVFDGEGSSFGLVMLGSWNHLKMKESSDHVKNIAVN